MHAAAVVLAGLAWFYLIYRTYITFIERKVVVPDDDRPTPAHSLYDGVDYVPAHPGVLFGHHFASIAGAGPIVGSIIAYSLFGWGPALLWILLGTAFIGIVHDYLSLMVSVRNRGVSIAEVARKVISPTAKWLFSVFVWLALILVIAVFAVITAKTLVDKPEIVIPTISLIFIAVLFGLAVYRWKVRVLPATAAAWLLLAFTVWLGYRFPVKASFNFWFYFFLVYAYIASNIPVWVLLQPRDYLSMTILFVGLVIGYAGLLALNPAINGPALVSFNSARGPLFPMLFVIIACGAISGFHSLVASGTTAKQLDRESHGKMVGAAAMLFEGALALLVLLLMAGALFWKKAPEGLSSFVFQKVLSASPIVAFGTGFARAVSKLGISLQAGMAFGILMLNAFVLTTLDTSVRLSRFVFQEAIAGPVKVLRNRWVAGAVAMVLAGLLAATNSYEVIWPVFGSANQLVAALSLFTVTAYLVGVRKPSIYTLIPALFMWIMTESALLYLLFFKFLPKATTTGAAILSAVTAALAVLGFIVGIETLRRLRRREAP